MSNSPIAFASDSFEIGGGSYTEDPLLISNRVRTFS
jgi:hypothetical protein